MRYAVALAGVLLATVAAADDRPAGYQGKYAEDPRFEELFDSVDRRFDDAIENVEEKLGISPRDRDRIELRVRDARPLDGDRIVPALGPLFRTGTDGEGRGKRVWVLVSTEPIVNGSADLEEELAHEAVHAVMRERMPVSGYGAVPDWIREGLALYAAEQVESRLLAIATSDAAAGDLDACFPGLDDGSEGLHRYAEYGMAIRHLERCGGRNAPRELARRIVAGQDPREAVEAAADRSWAEFRDEARERGRREAEAARPAEWEEYLAVRAHDRERDYDAVVDSAEEFLRRHPRSPLVPETLYWLGKAHRLGGDPEDALRVLRRLVDDHRGRTSYEDEAWYQIGAVLFAREEPAAAEKAFETLLRDYPDTGILDRALWRLAACSVAREDWESARARVAIFGRSFPESPVAGRVERLAAAIPR